MKKEFEFYIDKQVTIWERERHLIDAESEEEAKKIMEENFKKEKTDETFIESEFLYDTYGDFTTENDKNHPTKVLYYESVNNTELICTDKTNLINL